MAVHYAPLARAAQVQGDVHLTLNSGVVTLLAGHPLLARTALDSARALGSVQHETNLDLIYHFVLIPSASVPISTTIQRGNVFERAVMRMFRLKYEKVIREYRCEESIPPPNQLKTAGAFLRVWIYGTIPCPMFQEAKLVARR
jgi:hypothetical protein